MTDYRVLFITVPNIDVGRELARALLEARLAACVNIVPQVESLYWWEGKIQQDGEAMLVVKSQAGALDRLIETVRKNHPYDVPEVIAMPIDKGNPAYLSWLSESMS